MRLIICFHGEVEVTAWNINKDNYMNELHFMGFDFDGQSGESSIQTNWKINRYHIDFDKLFAWASRHAISTLHFTDIRQGK